MEKKENLIKGIEKGKAEIKEHKKEIRRLKKEMERLNVLLAYEEFDLGLAEQIIKKLTKELEDLK